MRRGGGTIFRKKKKNYNTRKTCKIRLGKQSVVMRSRHLKSLSSSKTLGITGFQTQKFSKLAYYIRNVCTKGPSLVSIEYYVVNVVNVYYYYLRLILKNTLFNTPHYFEKFQHVSKSQCFPTFQRNTSKNFKNKRIDKFDTHVSRMVVLGGVSH